MSTSDDRIAELERRVDALEAQLARYPALQMMTGVSTAGVRFEVNGIEGGVPHGFGEFCRGIEP